MLVLLDRANRVLAVGPLDVIIQSCRMTWPLADWSEFSPQPSGFTLNLRGKAIAFAVHVDVLTKARSLFRSK